MRIGRPKHSSGVATPGRASGFVVYKSEIYRSYFAIRISVPVPRRILLRTCSNDWRKAVVLREYPLSILIRGTGVGANHSAGKSLQISQGGIEQILPCQWHPLTVLNPDFCTTTYQRSISLICTTTTIASHCLDGLTVFPFITASPTHPETAFLHIKHLPRDVEKRSTNTPYKSSADWDSCLGAPLRLSGIYREKYWLHDTACKTRRICATPVSLHCAYIPIPHYASITVLQKH